MIYCHENLREPIWSNRASDTWTQDKHYAILLRIPRLSKLFTGLSVSINDEKICSCLFPYSFLLLKPLLFARWNMDMDAWK